MTCVIISYTSKSPKIVAFHSEGIDPNYNYSACPQYMHNLYLFYNVFLKWGKEETPQFRWKFSYEQFKKY